MYLSTGDVANLHNAVFRSFCRVGRMCSGIPRSYMVRVYGCMCRQLIRYLSVCVCVLGV